MTISVTTRTGKGSPLTTSEMDTNLTNLARDASTTVQGNVRMATQAEADAGSLTNVAISPDTLANSDFLPQGTPGTSGSVTFANGMILKWGVTAYSFSGTEPGEWSAGLTVTFASAFPTNLFHFTGTTVGTLTGSLINGDYYDASGNFVGYEPGGTFSASAIDLVITSLSNATNLASGNVYWIAIGN